MNRGNNNIEKSVGKIIRLNSSYSRIDRSCDDHVIVLVLPPIIPKLISKYVVEVANDDNIRPDENNMAPMTPHNFGP